MKEVKIRCKVGSIITTQEQINADIFATKKAEINAITEAKIFEILGVNNKEKVMII